MADLTSKDQSCAHFNPSGSGITQAGYAVMDTYRDRCWWCEIETLRSELAKERAAYSRSFEAVVEAERLRSDMASMRVFIQDCIDTGHDRGALGNLYACRDIIDRRSGLETEGQSK